MPPGAARSMSGCQGRPSSPLRHQALCRSGIVDVDTGDLRNLALTCYAAAIVKANSAGSAKGWGRVSVVAGKPGRGNIARRDAGASNGAEFERFAVEGRRRILQRPH